MLDDLKMMLSPPATGAFVHGLILQNARFDKGSMRLAELPPVPTALHGPGSAMQTAHMDPLPLLWFEP